MFCLQVNSVQPTTTFRKFSGWFDPSWTKPSCYLYLLFILSFHLSRLNTYFEKISPGFFSGSPPHKPAAQIQTLPLKKTNTNFSTLHLEYNLFVSKSIQMSNSDIFPNCWQYIQHLKVKVFDFQNFSNVFFPWVLKSDTHSAI